MKLSPSLIKSAQSILPITTIPFLLFFLFFSPWDWFKENYNLGNAILLLTGLAVLWYSWETWRLKEFAFEDVRTRFSRPLLIPIPAGINQDSKINLYLQNRRKGEANDLEWWISISNGTVLYGRIPKVWTTSKFLLYSFNSEVELRNSTLQIRYYWDDGKQLHKEEKTFILEPIKIEE